MSTNLSVVASRIYRTMNDRFETMEADAGFDAGEFSVPAHMRALFRDVAEILTECGWTALDFDNELIARTSPKWVERSGLIQCTVDEERDWGDC